MKSLVVYLCLFPVIECRGKIDLIFCVDSVFCRYCGNESLLPFSYAFYYMIIVSTFGNNQSCILFSARKARNSIKSFCNHETPLSAMVIVKSRMNSSA